MNNFLKEYLSTNSPSGLEKEAQNLWIGEMKKHLDSSSSIGRDYFGNAWFNVKSRNSKKRVVIESHVDEICWRVSHIELNGLVRILRNGGTDESTARGSRVVLFNPLKGESIHGVIGQKAIHMQKKTDTDVKIVDLYVDFGFKDREHAEKFVTIGDLICYYNSPMQLLGNRITSKAIDNKIGGYILTRVASELKNYEIENIDLIFLNAVQEETGLHGSRMFCDKNEFDYAIVTDVGHATDTPTIDKREKGDIKLGGGAIIARGSLLDESLVSVNHKGQMLACDNRGTGTDADSFALSNGGTPTALIKTPLRYMHTQTEVCDMNDVESVVDSILRVVLHLDKINQ